MSDYDLGLEIDPNNFIGHYNRGLLRAQVGDDNRAIEDFNFVLKIDPSDMMATFNRGLLLDQTGDYKGAIKDYTTVIEQYPNFLIGYQQRAQARKKIGDFKGAEEDELKVLRAQLERQNTSNRQTSQKKDDEDEDQNTRKRSDRNVNNYNKLVVADNEEGVQKYKNDYRGRVQDKNVSIKPQPMFALTYYEKYSEVKQQVNYYKFIEEMNSSKALPGRLLITNNETALTEEQAKLHFASIDEMTSAIVNHPEDVTKRFARALDFYLVQDLNNALRDLDDAIEQSPDFFPAYFMRALVRCKQLEYQRMGDDLEGRISSDLIAVKAVDYESVKRDLDKVIELAPDFVYAYYNRGNVECIMKDYRAALVDYDQCLQVDGKFAEAYFNRGLTNIYLGNNRQGILDLSKAGELGLYSAYNIIKRFIDVNE